MYSDPSLIRKHTVKVRFNDREAALVDAYCNFTGEEKAAFLRALILDRAAEVLAHGMQSDLSASAMRGTQGALFAA